MPNLSSKTIEDMFTNISWANYIAIIALLLIVYYAFVGIKFYSNELRQFILGKRKLAAGFTSHKTATYEDESSTFQVQQTQAKLFPSHINYTPDAQETDDTFQQVEELTASLKEAIAVAVDKEYIKEEFILSLQLLLKKYQFLKGSPFLVAINNLIASECEKYSYIQLSAEERVMLWKE